MGYYIIIAILSHTIARVGPLPFGLDECQTVIRNIQNVINQSPQIKFNGYKASQVKMYCVYKK